MPNKVYESTKRHSKSSHCLFIHIIACYYPLSIYEIQLMRLRLRSLLDIMMHLIQIYYTMLLANHPRFAPNGRWHCRHICKRRIFHMQMLTKEIALEIFQTPIRFSKCKIAKQMKYGTHHFHINLGHIYLLLLLLSWWLLVARCCCSLFLASAQ